MNEQVKEHIRSVVRTNGAGLINGQNLQDVLIDMVDNTQQASASYATEAGKTTYKLRISGSGINTVFDGSEDVTASLSFPGPEEITEEINGATASVKVWVTDQHYLTEHQSLAGLFASSSYSSNDKKIYFFDKTGTQAGFIDATAFIKDGMVDGVTINTGSNQLVITFNTDAGKEDITLDLNQIFNPDNYYTKSEVDTTIATLLTTASYQTDSASFDQRIIGVETPWQKGTGEGSVMMPGNESSGTGSVAQGCAVTASGNYSHAEGGYVYANGNISGGGIARGSGSHAEGLRAEASGNGSHAEGSSTKALGFVSHTEGDSTIALGSYSHAEGTTTHASGSHSHAEGYESKAVGQESHAEGSRTTAQGRASHAEGTRASALGDYSHAEGTQTTARGPYSHAEGAGCESLGNSSHAEGEGTNASGSYSHAEGHQTKTTSSGSYSHAEGSRSLASGICSHAEGYITNASGSYSHAEGDQTIAQGIVSHAEGHITVASGSYSHAEGHQCYANAEYSHAEGHGTITANEYEHAQGAFNRTAPNQIFSVGAGSSTDRKNAISVIVNPTGPIPYIYVYGVGTYDGTNPQEGVNDLATVIGSGGGGGGTSNYNALSNKPSINNVTLSGSLSLNDLSIEGTDNKVTALTSESTDTQYPSAKCVYDIVGNIEAALQALR